MSELALKVLEPRADEQLFREAFDWRPEPKRHVGANRASFEDFIADDPRQIVIGVFNGEFIAAFLLYEVEPKVYDCHVTSRRGTPKAMLVEGGAMIRDAFFENGAQELHAWIVERNAPLRQYLEALGFDRVKTACQDDRNDVKNSLSRRSFVQFKVCVGELPSECPTKSRSPHNPQQGLIPPLSQIPQT